jgi:hypothetical protein
MTALTLLTLLGISVAVAEDAPAAEADADGSEEATDAQEVVVPDTPIWGSTEEPLHAPVPPVPGPEVEPLTPDLEPPSSAPPAPSAEVEPSAPEFAPPTSLRRYDDGRRYRNGMPLLWTYSCGMGTLMGATLGAITGDEALTSTGAQLGGGAGALGMVLLRPDEISLDQSSLIASSGTLGAWGGWMLAATLIPEGAEAEWERIAASAVLGSAAGTAVGGLMKSPPPARSMLLVDVSTFSGWQMGAGIADIAELDPDHDRNLRAGMSLLGGGAFMVGGALAAGQDTQVDPGLVGMSLGHASWIGLWTPLLLTDEPSPQQVLGGMRLGLGAGTVAGLLLSPHVELTPKSVGLQLGGAGAGAAVGAGVPLALGFDEHPRAIVGPMLLGGVAGQALGAAVAPRYELTPSDTLLMGTIETWALYQGVGWGMFIQQANPSMEESQSGGMGLAIAGTGTLMAGAMGPLTEFSPAESIMVGSGGVWGTWYGAWGGELVGLNPEQHWAATLITGNLGLVGTAALASGDWDPDWRTVGLVDSMGLLGGAVGAMAGVIASPDLDGVAAGSLLGSSAGLVGGVLVSRNTQGRRPRVPRTPLLFLPHLDLPFRTRVSAAPWVAENGDPGAMVSLSLVEN